MKHDTRSGSMQDSTAQASFTSYAAPLVDAAVSHAAALSADPDAEVLHKLRVSLRRLRSLLWAYRPLLNTKFDDEQRALFKFFANAAGKTRDWDILIDLLNELDNAGHAPDAALTAARAKALGASRETLALANVKSTLRDALKEANKELNTAHVRTSLPKFARKRLACAQKSLDKRMKRASRARRSDYASYHEVRKAGKKLRYLIEFFAPLLAKKQKKTVKDLKKIQKRFGALNDVIASEALLRENHEALADRADVERAFDALEKERKRRVRAAAKLL